MKYVLTLAFLVSCASRPVQLSEKAKQIEVVVHRPVGCPTVGKIVGKDETGSKDVALNHALNQAADLEANILHVNQEVPNGKTMVVHATAYMCE